jgi:hypothetical protein
MRYRHTEFILAGLLLANGCAPAPEQLEDQPEEAGSTRQEEPRILHFYVSPPAVGSGQDATLCYGVEYAEAVALEPPVRKIVPGMNRCFTFAPERSGTYRLRASGPGGEVTAEFDLEVLPASQPPPEERPIITAFAASQRSVTPGVPVTLCYTAEGADSVRIDPPVQALEPGQHCFIIKPARTTAFKLTATRGEQTDEATATVTVQ